MDQCEVKLVNLLSRDEISTCFKLKHDGERKKGEGGKESYRLNGRVLV